MTLELRVHGQPKVANGHRLRLAILRITRALAVVSVLGLAPREALAWGNLGHRVIARIADQHLSPQAKVEAEALLGDRSLADVSTDMDRLRADRPEFREWHFVAIPRKAASFDRDRDCASGDCIIARVDWLWRRLADPSPSDHAEALKFLVHLIGDLHQPLHISGDNQGQNLIWINFFGRPARIHALWDSEILHRTEKSEAQLAAELLSRLQFRDIDVLQRGTPLDWAMEAHHVADDHAYVVPPGVDQGEAYYAANLPVLEEQLLKAGIRLAKVLNLAFAGEGPPEQAEPMPDSAAAQSMLESAIDIAKRQEEETSRQDVPPAISPWVFAWTIGLAVILAGVSAAAAVRLSRLGWRPIRRTTTRPSSPRAGEDPSLQPPRAVHDPGGSTTTPPGASNLGRPLKAFLCHSSTDKQAVRDLYRQLHDDGFDPWLDEEDLVAGQAWQLVIPEAVRASDVVIVCLSRGSVNKRGYVQKEIGLALDVAEEQPEGAIYLIPLRLEDCPVPTRLQRWHYVNYYEPGGYERLVRALIVVASQLATSHSS